VFGWNPNFHWRSPRDGKFIHMPNLSAIWGDSAYSADPKSTGKLYPKPQGAVLADLQDPARSFAPAAWADEGPSPERAAIHDAIVEQFLQGAQPTSEQPRLLSFGGGPASGKTSMRYGKASGEDTGAPPTRTVNPTTGEWENPPGGEAPTAVLVDPDAIKLLLPETMPMIAAGNDAWARLAHEESSYLAKRIYAAAVQRRLDVVFDGTGSNLNTLIERFNLAGASGYKIDASYMTVDVATAQARAVKRGEETGRAVDPEEIAQQYARMNLVIQELQKDPRLTTLTVLSSATNPPTVVGLYGGDNSFDNPLTNPLDNPSGFAARAARFEQWRSATLTTSSGDRARLSRPTKETVMSDVLVAEAPTSTAPFEGVIGVEGLLTGDGRLIEENSLEWAAFPLPLRWASADFGGHDGAVIVGRIDKVERRDNGDIYAWGVLDLGSKEGRECARLMRGQFLSGVSMDLDSVDSFEAAVQMFDSEGNKVDSPNILVTSEARVRAATLVSIPAFDEARLSLIASMGPNYRLVVGHGAFSLNFSNLAEEEMTFRLAAVEEMILAEETKEALAARFATIAPSARRARTARALAAKVQVLTGHKVQALSTAPAEDPQDEKVTPEQKALNDADAKLAEAEAARQAALQSANNAALQKTSGAALRKVLSDVQSSTVAVQQAQEVQTKAAKEASDEATKVAETEAKLITANSDGSHNYTKATDAQVITALDALYVLPTEKLTDANVKDLTALRAEEQRRKLADPEAHADTKASPDNPSDPAFKGVSNSDLLKELRKSMLEGGDPAQAEALESEVAARGLSAMSGSTNVFTGGWGAPSDIKHVVAKHEEDCNCGELSEQGVQTFATGKWTGPKGTSADLPGTMLNNLLNVLKDGGVSVDSGSERDAAQYAAALDIALTEGDWDTVFQITPDFYDATGPLYADFLESTGTATYAAASSAYQALEEAVLAASQAADDALVDTLPSKEVVDPEDVGQEPDPEPEPASGDSDEDEGSIGDAISDALENGAEVKIKIKPELLALPSEEEIGDPENSEPDNSGMGDAGLDDLVGDPGEDILESMVEAIPADDDGSEPTQLVLPTPVSDEDGPDAGYLGDPAAAPVLQGSEGTPLDAILDDAIADGNVVAILTAPETTDVIPEDDDDDDEDSMVRPEDVDGDDDDDSMSLRAVAGYSSARAEMALRSPLAFNWVEKAGGLPIYIKRIAKHLQEQGMSESHAIASAVNTVKRWSRGGKGVKADTVAKALAALADWEAKKATHAAVGQESFSGTGS
jgi:hypothetical protein